MRPEPAVAAPGASAPPLSPQAAEALAKLRRDGFCILRKAIAPELVRQMGDDLEERFARTPFCDGHFYGARTKRFGGVLKRSTAAEAFVRHSLVLELVEAVLSPFCDRFQLNLTQALQIFPGQGAQPPHRDEDMWGGPKGEMEYLVNVMWPFSSYTPQNGATVVFPGSHIGGGGAVEPVFAEMEPGDLLMFLGSTLHGGGANTTSRPRTGMIVSYSLGWLKPYENQWLVYPPAIARTFSPELAKLVGYQQHRPNLGNYEGQCPSVLLTAPDADYLGAVEELRPDQVEALRRFAAAQADKAA